MTNPYPSLWHGHRQGPCTGGGGGSIVAAGGGGGIVAGVARVARVTRHPLGVLVTGVPGC